MIAQLQSHWWLFLIRGILAIVLGILFLVWPGAAIYTLAILFGAYAFVDGIFAIYAAIRLNQTGTNWLWLLLEGVLGIIVGVLTCFYPGITALFLIYLFGSWAIVTGIFAVVSAFRLRTVIANEILMVLLGLLSIAAGIVIFFVPAIGAYALVWVISFYALLAGIFLIGLAFKLRGLSRVAGAV